MSILKKYQSTKNTCKVTFSYPLIDGVESVQVLGDFNGWDVNKAQDFKKGKKEFTAAIELPAGTSYEYRYLINGSVWENDTNADKYTQSPYYGTDNCVLVLDEVIAPVKKTTKKETSAKKATTAKKVNATKKATNAKKSDTTVAAKEVKPAAAPKKATTGKKATTTKKATTAKK